MLSIPRSVRPSYLRLPAVGSSLLLLLFALPDSIAKGKQDREIGPGPTEISVEEKAVQADPSAGIEHAVILVEETRRNEDLPTQMETRFHMRAKILSNEGRDLANVEIPIYTGRGQLRQWWGRTIQPDGEVLELPQSRLERQSVARWGRAELQVFKAALPGVIPGSVIDYGYVLREEGYLPYERIPLQRPWPIRELRYSWKPTRSLQGAYRLTHTAGLDIEAEVGKQGIVVTGHNLPPVARETLMPPEHLVHAALVAYYVPIGTEYKRYWKDVGKALNQIFSSMAGKKRSVQQAMDEMGLDPQAGLEERLQASYEWIGANLQRTGLRTFEEIQTAGDPAREKKDIAANLLASRQGSVLEIQLFYIDVARALGAEADLVFVPDRRRGLWDPELRTMNQFDGTLVAVRPKGAPDEQIIVADPGSGLAWGGLPWWFSGVYGMLVTKAGARPIELPSSTATDNVAECEVQLSFDENNESILSSWVMQGRGNVGLGERRYLRSIAPDDRADRIDELCGVGPETDIVAAEIVGIEELGRDLELQCETESWNTNLHERIGHYMMSWTGPWIQSLPDLPEGPREHPVVFDFPRVEILRVAVDAPRGFAPGDEPESGKVESAYGKYELHVERTDAGFRVERLLALYETVIPADEYEQLGDFLEEIRRLDRIPVAFKREGIGE